MKYERFKLLTMFLLVLGLTGLHAQTAILATGSEALGSGGSASYSIGQVIYTTSLGTNGMVAQGIQQPFEISVVTSLENTKDINLLFSAYPNPTTDYLILKTDASTMIQSMNYQLFDMSGKLLKSKKIEGNQTNISMTNLVNANYFLKVIQNNKEIKMFKIIKH